MTKSSLLALAVLAAPLGHAQEAAHPAAFKNTLAAGLTLTEGNSETMQANATLLSVGEREGLGAIRAGAEANYGESTVDEARETTVENAKIFLNAKKTLSRITFSYLDTSLMYDDVALVDYRATLGPGAGLYLIKEDKTSLLAEIGPAYIWEKVDGLKDDYLAARFAQRFDHALSGTAKVWQSAEYLPEASDATNYLLNAEVGVEAALNSRLNLRLVYQLKYDNQPADGLAQSDRTLIAGISVSL